MTNGFKELSSNFTKIPNKLWSMPLSNLAKCVLGYIASRKYLTISRSRLMTQLGIGSKDTLNKALNELKDYNMLAWKRGSKEGGANLYTVNPPELWRSVEEIEAGE